VQAAAVTSGPAATLTVNDPTGTSMKSQTDQRQVSAPANSIVPANVIFSTVLVTGHAVAQTDDILEGDRHGPSVSPLAIVGVGQCVKLA
jgi:hypothetical protein